MVRLIEAQKFLYGQWDSFQEWDESRYPAYAIVSHRWEDEEVNFQDVLDVSRAEYVRQRAGYHKIANACRQALKDDLEWIWIDTCCIDKKSSAELQEAINSMFRYYQNAQECYVYLSDLDSACPQLNDYHEGVSPWLKLFKRSKWFTRGWTLQELLAPRLLSFYCCDWTRVAYLEDVVTTIFEATGIDKDVLLQLTPLSDVAVARRMSWAAGRLTTRVEDQAYSLLGLFGVNMPMLYGERGKAFQRLQLEITKSSTDRSIFAWLDETQFFYLDLDWGGPCSIFARSPYDFNKAGSIIVPVRSSAVNAFEMTNAGLRIDTQLIPTVIKDHYIAPLYCQHETGKESMIGLPLAKDQSGGSRYYIPETPMKRLGSVSKEVSSYWTRLAYFDAADVSRSRPINTITILHPSLTAPTDGSAQCNTKSFWFNLASNTPFSFTTKYFELSALDSSGQGFRLGSAELHSRRDYRIESHNLDRLLPQGSHGGLGVHREALVVHEGYRGMETLVVVHIERTDKEHPGIYRVDFVQHRLVSEPTDADAVDASIFDPSRRLDRVEIEGVTYVIHHHAQMRGAEAYTVRRA